MIDARFLRGQRRLDEENGGHDSCSDGSGLADAMKGAARGGSTSLGGGSGGAGAGGVAPCLGASVDWVG